MRQLQMSGSLQKNLQSHSNSTSVIKLNNNNAGLTSNISPVKAIPMYSDPIDSNKFMMRGNSTSQLNDIDLDQKRDKINRLMTLQSGLDDSTSSKVKIKLVRPDSARNSQSNVIPKRPMSSTNNIHIVGNDSSPKREKYNYEHNTEKLLVRR